MSNTVTKQTSQPVAPHSERRLRIVVGIATCKRPQILNETLELLASQTRPPDRITICPVSLADVDEVFIRRLALDVRIVQGKQGASAQRNAIIRDSGDADVIVFFDDDFFPAADYLHNVETLMLDNPNIVVATGTLIEDGIHGPGLPPDYARQRLAASPSPGNAVFPYYGAYGCNMIVRLAAARDNGLGFDENLPLYAWQEDIDFSRQLAPYGRVVKAEALVGIHLGAKRGRVSGVRLGYSQVANPIYLARKGTLSLSFAGQTLAKNLLANVGRLYRHEPYIDRPGRLKGNMLALLDLVRGRLHPQRVLQISD
jgi:GT2 family glycosyltransferase